MARPRAAPVPSLLLLLLALAVAPSMVAAFRIQSQPPSSSPSSRPPPQQQPTVGAPVVAPAAKLLLQRWGMLALAVVGPALALSPAPAGAFDAKGAKLFEENCSSCHVGGSNIIGYARAKTLKEDALKKNKYDNKEAIVGLLEKGAGVMPKYSSYVRMNGDTVPAKLSQADMGLVADYVLEMAKEGWK